MAILLAAIIKCYFYYAAGSHFLDLYGQLGEAFLEGNTYIPQQVFDGSYFRGKAYLYFGPIPALMVYIPIRLLFNVAVSEEFIVPFQTSIGTVCLTILAYQIASRKQRVNLLGLILVVLSIGLGSWLLFNCRAAHVYSAAISGGHCFSAMGALFLWWFLNNPQRKIWAILASFCFGLAVGSRITHIGNITMLLVACWFIWRTAMPYSAKFGHAIRLLLPWGIVMFSLAVYNYERFGNPFENGGAYMNLDQTTDPYNKMMDGTIPRTSEYFLPCMSCEQKFFGLKYIPRNIYYNLFSPLIYNDQFTSWRDIVFQQVTTIPPWLDNFLSSRGYNVLGNDYTFGLLVTFPFSAWFFVSLCDRRGRKEQPADVRTMITAIEIFTALTFILVLSYCAHTVRYQQDFGPWMMTGAGIYYLQFLGKIKNQDYQKLLLFAGSLMVIYGTFLGALYGMCADGRC